MSPELLIVLVAAALVPVYAWSFRRLPDERWQILASVPVRRRPAGSWRGANLTSYGFFLATATVAAAAIDWLLVRSAGATAGAALALGAGCLAVGLPASRWVARWVEGKESTLTVGGASFVGLLAAPLLALGIDRLSGGGLPPLPAVAALTVATAFGEGLGRLACLSYGCCYGRPIAELPAGPRRLLQDGPLGRLALVFRGRTKKIAYASGWDGVPVVPIQAISVLVLTAIGLAGLYLFLRGRADLALVVSLAGSQLWRVASELFRADERGGGRLTAYQWMALAAAAGAIPLALFLPGSSVDADLFRGLASLWTPGVILSLQALWVLLFVHAGWSRTTGARMHFHVHRSRI